MVLCLWLVLEIVSSAEVNQHRSHLHRHLHYHSPGGPVVPHSVPPHLGLAVFFRQLPLVLRRRRRRRLLLPPLSVPVPVAVDPVDHDSYCY